MKEDRNGGEEIGGYNSERREGAGEWRNTGRTVKHRVKSNRNQRTNFDKKTTSPDLCYNRFFYSREMRERNDRMCRVASRREVTRPGNRGAST